MAFNTQERRLSAALPGDGSVDAIARQRRLMTEVVESTVADLKLDVRTIRDHRFADMMWHIGALALTAVSLAGMTVAAYFKIQDRIDALSSTSVSVETKLEDLLQRIPPIQPSPAPATRK